MHDVNQNPEICNGPLKIRSDGRLPYFCAGRPCNYYFRYCLGSTEKMKDEANQIINTQINETD